MPTPRWTETVSLRKMIDKSGKVHVLVGIVSSWPKELWSETENKTGTLAWLEVPDGPFKERLINMVEHPERTCPRWHPPLHTDPRKPPKVGDIIYIHGRMYIDHGEDDIAGGMATVTSVDSTDVNGGTWVINVLEVSSGYYWSNLCREQEKLAKEYKLQWAHPDPDYGPGGDGG